MNPDHADNPPPSLLGPAARRRLNRLRYRLTLPVHRIVARLGSDDALRRRVDDRLARQCRYWLFGLGVNNSGTTLLYLLLRRHPEIRVLPKEGHKLTDALTHPASLGVRRLWTAHIDAFRMTAEADPAPALRAKYDWLHYYDRRPGILFEKSPPNTVRGPWLEANFPPARFIAIFRDAYAVAEGVRRRLPDADIRAAARHWAVANRILLDDIAVMQRVHRMTYEQLCTDPEAELARLEAFCELTTPIDRDVIRKPMSSRNADGVARPLTNFNASSHARLSPDDIAVINEEAGDVIDRLGYPRL